MELLPKELAKIIPRLYDQEKNGEDAIVYLKIAKQQEETRPHPRCGSRGGRSPGDHMFEGCFQPVQGRT